MLDPADKPKGKRKEKRKGPPGQRGAFTAVVALVIVVAFVALLLATRGPFIQRAITPTVPPPPTGTPIPTSTVTPIAVPSYQPLILTPLCSGNPTRSARWLISNSNLYGVAFTWIARSVATSQSGKGTVPAAAGGKAGTLELSTFNERGGITMSIYVEGNVQAFNLNLGIACTATPSSATQAR